MAWIFLTIAGVLEVVWAFAMKQSHSFTRPLYAGITIIAMIASFALLANTRIPNTTANVMGWLEDYNTYTAYTKQPLQIRAVRGLETAGTGGTQRIVAYRNDPSILKLHLPMPHKFLGVMQVTPLRYDVPGIFRTGGLEIRRPGSVRYLDGI